MPKLLADHRDEFPLNVAVALQRLQQFPFPTEGSDQPIDPSRSINHRRAAAAFLHSVLLYDHPDWVARFPQGFTDGINVYLSADHVDRLDADGHKHQAVPYVYHVLAAAFDDLVAQHRFPAAPGVGLPRVTREEVLALFDTVEMNIDLSPQEALSTILDAPSADVLQRLYASASPSWDLDASLLDAPTTAHGFADLHPLNRLVLTARINVLSDGLIARWADALRERSSHPDQDPSVVAAIEALGSLVIGMCPNANPGLFRLGRRIETLSQGRLGEATAVRCAVVQHLGRLPGFTEDLKEVLVNGLAGFVRPAPTTDARRARTFQRLEKGLQNHHVLARGRTMVDSLSHTPMHVAIAATQGLAVLPLLMERMGQPGESCSSEQLAWRDGYAYALPIAWVMHAVDERDVAQETAARWRHATAALPGHLASLALKGVQQIAEGGLDRWNGTWLTKDRKG